jgi:hypothetical protein
MTKKTFDKSNMSKSIKKHIESTNQR